ncbi:S-layer homology domain-containing protein [Tissierella sp. MB52-C2]|uniref:S-layer homology domain-containing protein n=1 Tax=Tissierella sp. MB52-C2 TaxID=3070999 RepID=UPI00280A88BE|nr:S-layer homology domain-containing protein [Tissierella sp. MB52-C2]WMM24337.1 S-layer homology domain-containing protein [Tissierella sp. MB52-C2]
MKIKTTLILLIICLLTPYTSMATPLEFVGGVQNEHQYEEIVFITGQPIKFIGSYSVSGKIKNEEESVTYKFKLQSEDPKVLGKLDRTVTYTTSLSKHTGVGQTIGQTTVSKYKETIRVGNDTYDLTDYQFSKSDIIDERAASDFYSGNIKGRKYYDYNRGQGNITIDITGGNVGYENFWGSTETQIIDHIITADLGKDSFQGSYTHQVSDSMTKSLRYSENDPNYSSFHGGHIRITENNVVSKYDYRLSKKHGTISLSQDMVPKLERLIVPKFRDVNGHWAEENIKKLYSLDVFEGNSSTFAPDAPMTRLDFTKAIMKASDIRTSMEETKKTRRKRNQPEEVPYFKDIPISNEDYKYVKSAVEKNIVSGISKDLFGPNKSLKRSEAITILVRALGFENRAPNPGYITSFSDDRDIPNWAKDSIYMAKELNLLDGDKGNRISPNSTLTRAEASSLIVRFLEFLEKDLQKDYRDNIIEF